MTLCGMILLGLSLFADPGRAAPSSQQQAQVLNVSTTHSTALSYLLFLPASYSKSVATRWPLILYLHEGSLRGDRVELLRTPGLPRRQRAGG